MNKQTTNEFWKTSRIVSGNWKSDRTGYHAKGYLGVSIQPLSTRSRASTSVNRQRRLSGHVVVALTADGLVVKRLGKTPEGGWMLESDHLSWESVPWQPDTELIGEVVRMARSLLVKKFTIIIALSCFSPSNALAWCDEPSTPKRTPIKPSQAHHGALTNGTIPTHATIGK